MGAFYGVVITLIRLTLYKLTECEALAAFRSAFYSFLCNELLLLLPILAADLNDRISGSGFGLHYLTLGGNTIVTKQSTYMLYHEINGFDLRKVWLVITAYIGIRQWLGESSRFQNTDVKTALLQFIRALSYFVLSKYAGEQLAKYTFKCVDLDPSLMSKVQAMWGMDNGCYKDTRLQYAMLHWLGRFIFCLSIITTMRTTIMGVRLFSNILGIGTIAKNTVLFLKDRNIIPQITVDDHDMHY